MKLHRHRCDNSTCNKIFEQFAKSCIHAGKDKVYCSELCRSTDRERFDQPQQQYLGDTERGRQQLASQPAIERDATRESTYQFRTYRRSGAVKGRGKFGGIRHS